MISKLRTWFTKKYGPSMYDIGFICGLDDIEKEKLGFTIFPSIQYKYRQYCEGYIDGESERIIRERMTLPDRIERELEFSDIDNQIRRRMYEKGIASIAILKDV